MKKFLLLSLGFFVFSFLAVSNAYAADTITGSSYFDNNSDGTVDTIIWVMDEDPALCPYEAGDWAVDTAGTIGITAVTGVTCATLNQIAISVTATAGITGGAVDPIITYTAASGTANSVTLAGGAMTNKSSTSVDDANPQIRSITYQDADGDSKMDRLDVIYTEQVADGSFLSANDLLLNVVGSFTGAIIGADGTDLINVGVPVSTTWVPLGTEASVVATRDILGTLDITAQNSFSLLDGSGNNTQDTDNAAQAQLTWTDGIDPLLLSAERTALNTIVLTFSEDMDTTTTAGEGYAVAGATVTANTDPADASEMMTLTTTGLTSTSSTPAVTYTSAAGTTVDIANREVANASTVNASDSVAPTLAITLSNYVLGVEETAVVTFTFSEAPTGFTAADVTVANGTLGVIDATNPLIQTAVFTPTSSYFDDTNVIVVGTTWTDSSVGTNTPVGTTSSANYAVNTRSSSGGSSGGGHAVTTTTKTTAPGCSGGNLFNTSTGAACTNNEKLEIPGCGNRNTGFSTSSGVSCAGNKVSSTVTTTTTTTTTTKYNLGNTTLKNGSKGEAVKELQRFLNAKLNLGLVIDGSLGPKTIAVIKKWQMDNGLVADGLVGAKTKAMMNK
jgi:hypothetical protein